MRKLSLLLFLVACGDDGVRHTPDATTHDAVGTPDAPADASPATITLTITSNGAAKSGTTVYFQNADSSLVLATTTDANGVASAVMQPGGFVTAVQPFLALYGRVPPDEVATFVGVQAGDHLRLDTTTPTSYGINFTGPTSTNVNVASYSLFSPCIQNGSVNGVGLGSSGSTPIALYNCGATTDFLEVAYDANAGALEYYRATGVAVSASGSVDLSAQTFTAVTPKSFTYANVPATWAQPSIIASLAAPSGRIYGEQFSGSLTAATTRGIPAFAGAIDITASSFFNGTAGIQQFIDWGPFSATYTLDAGTHALPDLTSSPSYAAATHQVTVSEGAGGVTPDFTRLTINAMRPTDGRYWAWAVVSPHATTITLPTLPTTGYDYNISATDSVINLDVLIGKVPGGYDAIRPYLASFDSMLQFITTPSGSMVIENHVLAFSGKPRALTRRTR